MSDLITPDELPRWVPGELTMDSAPLGWDGVRIRGYRYTALDVPIPGLHDYLVVASNGGSAGHTAWYRNLDADPHVHVQVGAEEFDATARTATGEERERLWPLAAAVWPAYDEYQTRTARQIPVVVLTPVR